MTRMPFAPTDGGQLHSVFPPKGRFGGESAASRNAARAAARAAAQQKSGQEEGQDRHTEQQS